jgi:hypothetical protein
MRFLFILSLFLFLQNCGKPKTVLICGDHVCVNKKEAEQYFEENLSIEVKLIDVNKKNKKQNVDLIELNLNLDDKDKRKIAISKKTTTNKKIKLLSNNEIKKIKSDIKKKKKKNKIVSKKIEKKIQKNKKQSNLKKNNNNIGKNREEIVDICTILDKCSIDEISKYLLNLGKKKDFPDITIRE